MMRDRSRSALAKLAFDASGYAGRALLRQISFSSVVGRYGWILDGSRPWGSASCSVEIARLRSRSFLSVLRNALTEIDCGCHKPQSGERRDHEQEFITQRIHLIVEQRLIQPIFLLEFSRKIAIR